MSSCSNYNTNNTRFITLALSSLTLSLKIYSILKSLVRGMLLFKLIWWPISLIPSVRSLVSKRLTCRFKLVAVILLPSKIISTYLRCVENGLVYITIIALFSHQPSFYIEYTKLNIYSFYNIYLVFNAKYTFLARLYIC